MLDSPFTAEESQQHPLHTEGLLLLESNPLRGLKLPREKNPARVLLTHSEYETLLGVSLVMDWRFRVALVIVHETGHRIGAIRKLRWSDIDMEGDVIRWRAEHEKTGNQLAGIGPPNSLSSMDPTGLGPVTYCRDGSCTGRGCFREGRRTDRAGNLWTINVPATGRP